MRTDVVDAAGREFGIEALGAERLQVVNQERPQVQHVMPTAQFDKSRLIDRQHNTAQHNTVQTQ